MRCNRCLAEVAAGVYKCPKCGGTVFSGETEVAPLRSVTQFFSTPISFYVKAKPPVVVNGELVAFETEWKLYMARLQQNAPHILLWDRDGYLPGKQEASLHLVEGEDLFTILNSLPEKKLGELKALLQNEWGLQFEEGNDFVGKVSSFPIFYQPVPRLRDPSILKGMDWRGYVERLACPKPGKDSKLVQVHLAKILQPLAMHYAPHSLEVTNSNTGKTRFYDSAGVKIDRATRRAVLGFAKSPKEVFPGTINGTTLPTAFDQIESQDSYELAKYMLDIMETGKALVDSGGIRFVVETGSSFAYLGNPVAKDAKVVEGFKALLNHICANPAMGRRFGLILFATGLKTIQSSEKMTLKELEEWKRSFILFRAVEEYAQPSLRQMINDPAVAEWLHMPIKGYREAIYKATEQLDDYNLAAFFESHGEATHRVRGAALHAAAALLLDKIALGEATAESLLELAEELLPQYVQINLDSIATLCQMWEQLRTDQAVLYYENCPDYLKEIISAIIHHKRSNMAAVSVQLEQIPYEPENKGTYAYFSKCIDRLKRRKRLGDLNETLRNYFGFQIISNNGNFTVEYFENPKPPEELKLIGKYGFLNFSDFSISQPSQTQPANEQQGEEPNAGGEAGSGPKKQRGVSENIEKWRKMRNGEKFWPAFQDAVSIRGACTTEEFAQSAQLSQEEALKVLEEWQREGRVFSPYSGWWKEAEQ
jgi:hypothetical protein